jgi:metal-responsive CopG/Arc/MetJ family transcriptional regulator
MNRLQLMQRKTQRVTVSMPQGVMEELLAIADEDGRSLSNLIAFMVESRLEQYKKGRGAQSLPHGA